MVLMMMMMMMMMMRKNIEHLARAVRSEARSQHTTMLFLHVEVSRLLLRFVEETLVVLQKLFVHVELHVL